MSAVASELLCPSHNTGIASEVSPEWGNFLESFLRSALSWASSRWTLSRFANANANGNTCRRMQGRSNLFIRSTGISASAASCLSAQLRLLSVSSIRDASVGTTGGAVVEASATDDSDDAESSSLCCFSSQSCIASSLSLPLERH